MPIIDGELIGFYPLLKLRLRGLIHDCLVAADIGYDIEVNEEYLDYVAKVFIDLIDVQYANAIADLETEFFRYRKVTEEEAEELDDVLAIAEATGDLVTCRNKIIEALGLRR